MGLRSTCGYGLPQKNVTIMLQILSAIVPPLFLLSLFVVLERGETTGPQQDGALRRKTRRRSAARHQ